MVRADPGNAMRKAASKIGALRELLFELLQKQKRDDAIPTNARFLFYELVQSGDLSKEQKPRVDDKKGRRPDQDLHDALTDIRENGSIPWRWIVDETRSLEDYTGYKTIKDGVLAQLRYIKLDPWKGRAPLILTESRSLLGVLRNIAIEYRVRIASTNGQVGGFLRTDIAPVLQPNDRVVTLWDLDLSGGHIEGNVRRVLERKIGGALDWERLALTEEQVREYDLPVIVKKDKRFKKRRFQRKWTEGPPLKPGEHEAVETEAISQRVLNDILRARLDQALTADERLAFFIGRVVLNAVGKTTLKSFRNQIAKEIERDDGELVSVNQVLALPSPRLARRSARRTDPRSSRADCNPVRRDGSVGWASRSPHHARRSARRAKTPPANRTCCKRLGWSRAVRRRADRTLA